MLGTALVALVLLVGVQILLVVTVADKLTQRLTGSAVADQNDRVGALQAAGRYAQPA